MNLFRDQAEVFSRLDCILNPVTLELLCKCKIDLNQFTIIVAPPSRWGVGGLLALPPSRWGEGIVYWLNTSGHHNKMDSSSKSELLLLYLMMKQRNQVQGG